MWSSPDVVGLFSNKVVSFSSNVVLRGLLFSINLVSKPRMLSVRGDYVLSSLQLWLRPLPPGDVNQFAMMGVNPPTAYLLLTDIVKLPRGSWVIQNGANSGVGQATIAIAKSLGLRTVNVVRREKVVAEMKALGGDVVLVDGPDLGKRGATETGSAPITLALDGGSDTSPMNLMHCLSESGVLVC